MEALAGLELQHKMEGPLEKGELTGSPEEVVDTGEVLPSCRGTGGPMKVEFDGWWCADASQMRRLHVQ